VNGTSAGFVASYIGLGPPPGPVASAAAPTVSTGPASAVSQLTATVGGQVNPNGLATTYSVQYGTSTSYGSTSATASAGAGSTAVPVSVSLTGLTPGTTYHYRLVATNSAGTTNGADAAFTTRPGSPTATTGTAAATEISARVAGTVGTGVLATTYQVQYGRTSAYGSTTATVTAAASSSLVKASAVLKGLSPATTYHYRVIARNSVGTASGVDKTFKTEPRLKAKLKVNRLWASVGCNQACSVKGSLMISAGQAKALGLGLTIGRGSGSLRRTGTTRFTLGLTREAKKALAGRRIAATLKIVAHPVGGGRSVTLRKTVVLTG
jgi:phosphodiesterase/alkaline phosphatase D-like protein